MVTIKKIFKYLSLLLWALIILFPITILFFGSFMTRDEFYTKKGIGLPDSFSYLANYSTAVKEGHLLRGFVVTFTIMLISIFFSVILGSMVAYVIHRFTFKGRTLLLFLYFLISSVPMVITQVGTFKLMTSLHLYNTMWAPIILYIGADVTMIYLYLQNMEQIPDALDQAAIMDGASFFQIYRYIILPLLTPATMTVITIKSLSIYNDFYIPYLYMPRQDLPTISTAIFRFVGPFQTQWEIISACIILSMLPLVVLYLWLQRYIDQETLQGGMKG